jgi:hypothetical protein
MAQPIWNTASGSIGTFPSGVVMVYQLSASAVLPAVTVTYAVISGSLPNGVTMDEDGLIAGIPTLVTSDVSYSFVVRATDNYANLRDRTFTITTSGAAVPQFTTPTGTITTTLDSTWIEIPVEYLNPVSTNPVSIRLIQGQLPPGIEINTTGLLRGYAAPPLINLNLGLVTTSAVASSSNTVVCLSTSGFRVGRPIQFTGTVFGGVTFGQTYYIQSIIDESTFTISTTVGGPVYLLSDAVGFMNVTLPNISIGQPTVQTYSFTLKLESPLGSDIESYSITVINQNATGGEGGPSFPPNTRVPTIYNTRPSTYNISANEQDFGYYVLPPDSGGFTYAPSELAYIGKITSDNYFTFRMLGHDFDGNALEYVFADLPLGLVGNITTGWIEGTPIIADNSINEFSFSVAVRKAANPAITTPNFNFSFRIRNEIVGDIAWLTPSDLGQIFNGTVSTERVKAISDVTLQYRLIGGQLPPNLTLLSNGEISGVVAYQPTEVFLDPGLTTDFSFTIQAYSPQFPVIQTTRTFTWSVYQEYNQPTDTLYIKCVPSIADRRLLASLLNSTSLIPEDSLYRPNDPYFGKATSIIYEHAYGIYASSFEQYVAAITKNHYWRNITLGELKTAIARDDNGNIIYEVVYSQVIDNLVNPSGTSIQEEIYWPRPIPLELGPWYTSETNLFTSYVSAPNGQEFYTSLTPGFARVLYPNSLPNMRQRVGQNLGQEFDFRLLPKWMTSQQRNGSTLGYTPAWVIAYCVPGIDLSIVASQTNSITNEITVTSTEGFVVGRQITFTGTTFGGISTNSIYYVREVTSPTTFTISIDQNLEQEFSLSTEVGSMNAILPSVSYAEVIKDNINTKWVNPITNTPYTLNTINFTIDRFTVDKSITFNYDTNVSPPAWTGLPSASPTPSPLDSKDFYVLYPRKTILPDQTQY